MSLFALISGVKLALGHQSCGCLGRIDIPPLTILCVDAAFVVALCAFSPFRKQAVGIAWHAGVLVAVVAALCGVVWDVGSATGLAAERPENDEGCISLGIRCICGPSGGLGETFHSLGSYRTKKLFGKVTTRGALRGLFSEMQGVSSRSVTRSKRGGPRSR